jgi:hypothetical protein
MSLAALRAAAGPTSALSPAVSSAFSAAIVCASVGFTSREHLLTLLQRAIPPQPKNK